MWISPIALGKEPLTIWIILLAEEATASRRSHFEIFSLDKSFRRQLHCEGELLYGDIKDEYAPLEIEAIRKRCTIHVEREHIL